MTDRTDFHGVLPALITPFSDDGARLDEEALAQLVDRLIAGGVGGLVPGGSTGEFTTLTHAERERLAEVTIEAADGRVPVVVATGALSTRETVELSVHAERAGAAAVMIVPPFYDTIELARAARALPGGRGPNPDPDHVLQPARRDRRHARPGPVPRAAPQRRRDRAQGHRR